MAGTGISKQEREKIRRIVEKSDLVEVNVIRVARKGKASIRAAIEELLSKFGADFMAEDVFASVIELVFNAIKANYRYLYIRDAIRRMLIEEEIANPEQILEDMVVEQEKLIDAIAKIDMSEVQRRVRSALSDEESITKVKERAAREQRALTPMERSRIAAALNAARHAKREGLKVYLRMAAHDDSLIIDVVNTAPIFPDDLKRIHEKRESFRKYRERGEEQNFYIENIDETQSAGFGAAMIDARLYNLDIIPQRNFDIWGYNDKTNVSITFPLGKVKREG